MKKTIFTFSIVALLAVSCKKDMVPVVVTDPNCADTISFAAKIQPLINQNCATSGCHDANTQQSGYNLSTYAGISANAEIMLKTMRHESGVTAMPYGTSALPDSSIQQFSCWTSQGKLDN